MGKMRFVIWYGVIGWAVPVAIIVIFLTWLFGGNGVDLIVLALASAALFPIFGWVWGHWAWKHYERVFSTTDEGR
jgi:hypothetical protein